MARRKREEEHENHERWLVSYADFITLLFAFFVVMYAISQVNEGKYRVLSDSLVTAFRSTPANASGASIVAPPVGAPIQLPLDIKKPTPAETAQAEARRKAKADAQEKVRKVKDELTRLLEPLARSGQVRITETDRGVSVEINSNVLFEVGRAAIDPVAAGALSAIAALVAPSDFTVLIEGHTDNVPIATEQFPSNWELSAVRATTVLRLFEAAGVSAQRLTAIGYGEQRPLESNESVQGRARNRRVVVLIETPDPEALLSRPVLTGNAASG